MDFHLTEIKNAHLFMEYLMSSGVKSPRSQGRRMIILCTS